MATQKTIRRCLDLVAGNCPGVEVRASTQALWVDEFRDVPDDVFEDSIRVLMRTDDSSFWPTIGKVWRCVMEHESVIEAARLWRAALRGLETDSNGDARQIAAREVLVRIFGSIEQARHAVYVGYQEAMRKFLVAAGGVVIPRSIARPPRVDVGRHEAAALLEPESTASWAMPVFGGAERAHGGGR